MTSPEWKAGWLERVDVPAAVNTMAVQLAADIVAELTEPPGLAAHWRENYPEVGEQDWERIVARAREITRPPGVDVAARALTILARRAGTEQQP